MATRIGMIVTLVLGLGLLWFGLSEPPSASASAPAQVETNTPPPWRVEIYEQVNVRAGPGTQYDLVGILIPGQTSEVIGRSTTGTWLKIVYVGGPDNAGWVLREFVRVVGDSPNMPTIEAPPTPTLPPTPLAGVGDPGAEMTVTPDPDANRLPTFTPPAPEVRATLLPAQGLRPTSGFPPAVLIIVLFVLGTFGGLVSLLRRR